MIESGDSSQPHCATSLRTWASRLAHEWITILRMSHVTHTRFKWFISQTLQVCRHVIRKNMHISDKNVPSKCAMTHYEWHACIPVKAHFDGTFFSLICMYTDVRSENGLFFGLFAILLCVICGRRCNYYLATSLDDTLGMCI